MLEAGLTPPPMPEAKAPKPGPEVDWPKFSKGGLLFQIQYGYGWWAMNRALLTSQSSMEDADGFIAQTKDTHALQLRVGYNILGHATISVDLTATGWDLTTKNVGGAGFLTGSVAWHPLELAFMNKDHRPIPIDFSLLFGAGYGIAGETRGLDGAVLQTSLFVDYFFVRYFGLGLFFKAHHFLFNKLYRDYYNRDQPGNSVTLNQGSGGHYLHFGLTLTLRAGD